ncbi:MAG: putative membrane protein, partial [Halobacteriales archaeon]
TTTNPGPTRGTSPLFWIGVGLLVVTVGAGGYYYAVQQRRPRPTVEGTDDAAAESESRTAGPTGETDADATTDETGHRQQSASGSAEGSGASAVDVEGAQLTEDDDGGIDPELLSDEERVERLLERNGGRMKQGDIVKETGWSNAKVSQLLSSMAEEERINKLRIGRENLITLPDEDVTDFGE